MPKKRKKKRKKKPRSTKAGKPAFKSTHAKRIQELLAIEAPLLDEARRQDGSINWGLVPALAEQETAAIEGRIVEGMSPYHAYDIVANMLIYNFPRNAEDYRESEHEGLLANVEYAASLCLRRPEPAGTGNRQTLNAGEGVERWSKQVRELLHLRGLGQRSRLAADETSLARTRHDQFGRELLLRNVAYDWQETALLRELFGRGSVGDDLKRVVGFSIDEALQLTDTITEWSVRRLFEGAEAGHREAMALRELIARKRQGEQVEAPTQEMARTLDELVRMPEAQLSKVMFEFVAHSAWYRLGDRTCFTAEEIAQAAGVGEKETAAFLEAFSQPFGQPAVKDPMRALQAVRAQPIMKDGATFQCVDGGDLLFTIRRGLELLLRREAGAWTRYERHRSDVAESAALQHVAGVLKPEQQHRSLRWTVGDQEFELDGLLIVDRYAITIEVKAGGFTEPARRAAPDRLRRDLQDLIASAHHQARRARDALLTSGTQFRNHKGSRVDIEASHIKAVLPLTITLEELGVSPVVWHLARTGFLDAGEEHPTTMSLYDLELVVDLFDRPSILLHYLARRQTFNQIGGVVAIEEADLVMYYLTQGLYVEDDGGPPVTFLPSLTDPIDAYYLHKHGKRKTSAKKPALRLHRELDSLIHFLEEQRPPGWSSTVCFLLDMSGDDQNALGRRIARMRALSRRLGKPHDQSLTLENPSRGLTVVTIPDDDVDQLREYVQVLSLKNKYVNKSESWSGIGIFAHRSEPFHVFMSWSHPWRPDPELDELAARAVHL